MKPIFTPEQEAALAPVLRARYDTGESIRQVAAHSALTYSVTRRLLKTQGPLRPVGAPQQ